MERISLLMGALAFAVPLTFVLAAALVTARDAFRPVRLATWSALALSSLFTVAAVFAPGDGPSGARIGALRTSHDAVTCAMLLLVCTLALVIGRYSGSYLRDDPARARYARSMLGALSAISLLIVVDDLRLLALAWTATSLALHELLTLYRDRPRALLAAHKKFLLSRVADLALLGAVGLTGSAVGSFGIRDLHTFLAAGGEVSSSLQYAALLFVLAVALKSAQLPFHGWLTQVMEAPTPVSALLHAGVVNIGGFVMIRLAPLLVQAPGARTVLLVVGLSTAVVAALVQTTRVSVKEALAWSTCAQMGVMLVQCGLGLFHLALLHLIAHSLYKAHAFLSAGSMVDAFRMRALVPQARPGLRSTLWAVAAAGAAVALAGGLVAHALGLPLTVEDCALALLLALALSPALALTVASGARPRVHALGRAVCVSLLYFAAHAAFRALVDVARPSDLAAYLGASVVIAGFVLLFAVQTLLTVRPDGRIARALHPHLYAGLYLDALFTRLTFVLWPPRMPQRAARQGALTVPNVSEA